MILEERNYRTYPGGAVRYLDLWETYGRAVQERILGDLRGVWISEIGDLNTIVYHWGFADLAERATRRGRLMADPVFTEFRGRVRDLLVSQQNRILVTPPPLAGSARHHRDDKEDQR